MTPLTKISDLTGKENTVMLPVSEARLLDWLVLPVRQRPFVQDAFPELSADDREFIKTGITNEEWDAAFPPEDEEGGRIMVPLMVRI